MLVFRTCGLVGLALAACVGTNPGWDGPADAIPDLGGADDEESGPPADDGTTDDGGVMNGTDGDATDGTSSTTGADGTTTAVDSTSGSMSTSTTDSSSEGGPMCPGAMALCDGECKDIAKDKHACGVACIDCTARFGNHATCEDGVCEGDGEGEGKGG